tara:strand:- start:177 stop:377 length:201 start_codon:yes stop_codon:yes gene_type:complete
MSHTFTFDDEELQCLQVCVSNAPIPYDISQKKIPADILAKIGEPIREELPPLETIKYDLSKYGITD